MEYKIINKTLYICDKWGNLGRRISENVVFGTFDDETSTFLITKSDGKVELKDLNGTVKRVISKDGFEARFQGNNIILRKKDGRTCIVDRNGNIQRYL
jgi:hypothetical protein